ncbi:MAG: alpha/beta hydrolase [Candidatus Marinimicrobia bacterium]|nr:alpha/beta hydrolase [Candidatus Neomarinimicrobiota bacterium]
MKIEFQNKESLFYFLLSVSVLITCASAQYNIGSYMGFQSDILGEQRVLVVGLPEGYEQTTERYPVLYLLDGNYHFHHVTGLIDFLADLDLIPRIIVVGLQNSDRNRDFTPTAIAERPASGGADNFLTFLEDELFPAIDGQFRTVPYRILAGHSLGGLFSIHAMLIKPELFNAHIIISPHVTYDDEFILLQAGRLMETIGYSPKALYIAIGEEEREILNPSKRLNRIIKNNKYKDFRLNFEVLDNTDHGSVVHKAVYNGLEFIYSGWKFPLERIQDGLPAIKFHYSNLSKRLGYTVIPQEVDLNEIGYALLNVKYNEKTLAIFQNKSKALAVFQYNESLYPNSPNVYDSLGDAYSALGQDGLALENFQIAVQKGEELSDPRLPIFREHLNNQLAKVGK